MLKSGSLRVRKPGFSRSADLRPFQAPPTPSVEKKKRNRKKNKNKDPEKKNEPEDLSASIPAPQPIDPETTVKAFAQGNPIGSNTGEASQSLPKSNRMHESGFSGTLLSTLPSVAHTEERDTQSQQKGGQKALPSEVSNSSFSASYPTTLYEREAEERYNRYRNSYNGLRLSAYEPITVDAPVTSGDISDPEVSFNPNATMEEEEEEEEVNLEPKGKEEEEEEQAPPDQEKKEQFAANMMRLLMRDFPRQSKAMFPEMNTKMSQKELYDIAFHSHHDANDLLSLFQTKYKDMDDVFHEVSKIGSKMKPSTPFVPKGIPHRDPLNPALAPSHDYNPYYKKTKVGQPPGPNQYYGEGQFQGETHGQVNGAFPPPDPTRVGWPSDINDPELYQNWLYNQEVVKNESKSKASQRLEANRQRGNELGQFGESAPAFGQAAGDRAQNQAFFQKKGIPNAQGTGDLADLNPAQFGQNGQVQQGDPNRLDPITPATGAASQRASNPNSIKKTRDFESFIKGTIQQKGPEAVFGNAYDRTNAVGAGGVVNDWTNNGPYDYPDRKVDPTLGLVGAWRTKAGGANTLWTSYMNAKGTGLNMKKNKYYKYSQRRKEWIPIKGDGAVNDYMKKRNCRGNQIYGVPTGTRFSSLVSKLRKHKIKDIRLARSGGELMEMRKHSSIGMERKGLGTQK